MDSLKDPILIFIYIVMTLAYIVTFRRVFSLLKTQGWSLAEALSEPSPPPDPAAPAAPAAPAIVPPVPFASSSRLIAFVGMVIIAIIFVGTGYYVIYALFNDASNISRNLKSVSHFLMFGGTLFAPYVFNKISSIGK
ncbi:hypothetical protein [Klebsiella quasipneumoniae]|uniref:hypothetical protein n=1 Tax=Klebsiella quasipneumoniae TaxID=1463165 RepID=UPI0009BB047E|nr:hypothetical protein [Klebsiella quasipneumoniae]MBV7686832.1 hypothetical protein [Klebsiella quasipneumoniae subsp. similipneumoniae]MCJ7322635.1 hypothetical protein [Klebsiella quasipneumoniae]MDP1092891.1 hypothetical protein [Klebsiella quasipneumoniae]MDS0452890.1 hypothetical protein [Klebsiella quasipneumoniae]MDS0478917.1 hypothetical protein [Klebsiella quasipneumoniae]